MSKLSKNLRSLKESVANIGVLSVEEAIEKLIELNFVNFDSSCDLCLKLGVDTRKSDQNVRGISYLPNGTGKKVKIAVFAEGDLATEAKEAGADVVGLDDLIEEVKSKGVFFDSCIASVDSMLKVRSIAKLLGPKGVMPNPKLGTVTNDIASAVSKIKAGSVEYRADKTGFVHCSIGKLSFGVSKLIENFNHVMSDIISAKPTASKGVYLRSALLSSTMGPGLSVDISAASKKR